MLMFRIYKNKLIGLVELICVLNFIVKFAESRKT